MTDNGNFDLLEIRQYNHKDKPGVYKVFLDGMSQVLDYGKINMKNISLIMKQLFLKDYGFIPISSFNIIFISILTRILSHFNNYGIFLNILFSALILILIWFIAMAILIKYSYSKYLEYYHISINSESDYKDLNSWLIKGEKNLWVAVYKNEVVGTIAILNVTKENNSKKIAELKRMYVSSDMGRKGIASKLYQTLENWCIKNNYSGIHLSTSGFQVPAIYFYLKMGFKLTKTEKLVGRWFPMIYFFEKEI